MAYSTAVRACGNRSWLGLAPTKAQHPRAYQAIEHWFTWAPSSLRLCVALLVQVEAAAPSFRQQLNEARAALQGDLVVSAETYAQLKKVWCAMPHTVTMIVMHITPVGVQLCGWCTLVLRPGVCSLCCSLRQTYHRPHDRRRP